MLPDKSKNNTQPIRNYPRLPEPPANASNELWQYHESLSLFYDDLKKQLRTDFEELLAKINA